MLLMCFAELCSWCGTQSRIQHHWLEIPTCQIRGAMAWTWSLQAAFGTKLPTEVWDHITAFADPREQSVSMPSAPTTSPKVIGFLTPSRCGKPNLSILVNMFPRLSLSPMRAEMEIHRYRHVLFLVWWLRTLSSPRWVAVVASDICATLKIVWIGLRLAGMLRKGSVFSLEVKALPNALCVAFLTRQADRAMPGVLLESQSWGLGLGRLCLPKNIMALWESWFDVGAESKQRVKFLATCCCWLDPCVCGLAGPGLAQQRLVFLSGRHCDWLQQK